MNYSLHSLHSSPIAELLDMVERRAPLLMRCGGLVALEQENPNVGRALSPEKKAKIRELFLWQRENGRIDLHAIADAVGVHYQTVSVHTRELRQGMRRAKAARA